MLDQPWRPSRRLFLAGSAATAVALAACGGASDPEPGASGGEEPSGAAAPSGPWTFTDDRGREVTADEAPVRIVAHSIAAAALWDFGIEVVGIFGPQRRDDGTPHPSIGEIDLDGIVDCGQVFDQLNIEKIASLRPDLVVSTMYEEDELWYVGENFAEPVEALAPTVGISLIQRPATKPMARFEALATSLGADTDSPAVVEARTRYEDACAAVEDAVAANPGLTVLVAAPNVNEAYFAKPEAACDLRVFQELGVEIVEPGGPDEYWETVSLEQLDKYPADLIMLDVRTLPLDVILERAAEVPTWTRLPAVEAGQVVPWYAEGAYGYNGFAAILEELAEAVRTSDADLV